VDRPFVNERKKGEIVYTTITFAVLRSHQHYISNGMMNMCALWSVEKLSRVYLYLLVIYNYSVTYWLTEINLSIISSYSCTLTEDTYASHLISAFYAYTHLHNSLWDKLIRTQTLIRGKFNLLIFCFVENAPNILTSHCDVFLDKLLYFVFTYYDWYCQ